MAVAFAIARGGSGHAAACGGSVKSGPTTAGDYPLAVSVRPLHIGTNGDGTYEISVTDSATHAVPRACLVIVEETHWRDTSGSSPTPKISSGEVRSAAKLKETTSAAGHSYSVLVRAPKPGRTTRLRVVATPAPAHGSRLTCLTVAALIPGTGTIGSGNFQGSLQAVCLSPGRRPPSVLPIEVSLRGPSRTRTGELSEYTVTLRNRSPQPLHGIGIGIAQATSSTPRGVPVATDYGLTRGTQRREEVRVRTLGSAPITFHLWWRAGETQQPLFAIETFHAGNPNARELLTTELLSSVG